MSHACPRTAPYVTVMLYRNGSSGDHSLVVRGTGIVKARLALPVPVASTVSPSSTTTSTAPASGEEVNTLIEILAASVWT